MENKTTDSLKTRLTVLFICKMIMVALGIGILLYDLVASTNNSYIFNIIMCILGLTTYICMFIHIFWGYKKTTSFFQLALTIQFAMFILAIYRGLEQPNASSAIIIILSVLTVMALLGFMVTYKKQEQLAQIFGLLMVILSLALPVVKIVIWTMNDIPFFINFIAQFNHFIVLSTIYALYMSRIQWKKAGKPDVMAI